MGKKEVITMNIDRSKLNKKEPSIKYTEGHEKERILCNVRSPKNRDKEIIKKKHQQLLLDYSYVIVRDFDDEYHLSEEEKLEKFRYYETAKSLRQCKRKYRKLSKYVLAFRLCLKALDVVANNNNIYSVNEFKRKVAEGDIVINGIEFPKYVGKDKKDVNWDYIFNVILDDSIDPKILDKVVTEYDIDFDDEDELDEFRKEVLGDDYESTLNSIEEDEVVYIDDMKHKFYKSGMKNGNIQNVIKNLSKLNREYSKSVNNFVYDMSRSDFDYARDMDRRLGLDSCVPKFKGNIMNKEDYDRYMYELHEWELNNVAVKYGDKIKTLGEARNIEIKDYLEEKGWNLRTFYSAEQKKLKAAEKKQRKEDAKKEKRLKQRLIEIQKKRGHVDENLLDDDKKKKKKKKKNKKKKKKKEDD